MIGSVVLFGFEGADAKVAAPIPVADKQLAITHLALSTSVKVFYSFAAMGLGIICPIGYTFSAFSIRKFCKNYTTWDLGIDALICEHSCYCCMYVAYLTYSPWRWEEFIYGQLVGILFLVGKQTLIMAYAEGPGGPVNTIIIS